MKERLLNSEFENFIYSTIFNSKIPNSTPEFDFVEEFELLCLNQFVIFKTIFESLLNIEKDEVIKFWFQNKQDKIERIFEYFPKDRKNFDPYRFESVDLNIIFQSEPELLNYNKLFTIEHYKSKFVFLIIHYLENELDFLLKFSVNPRTLKNDFNPLEYLDLKGNYNISLPIDPNNPFQSVKKKYIGNLFWVLFASGLIENQNLTVENFCIKLCLYYGVHYTDTIRQNFRKPEKHLITTFKSEVIHLIPSEHQSIITEFLSSLY